MIIKECNLVVVKDHEMYGFMNLDGKPVLGVIYTNVFLETVGGVTDYCAIYKRGEQMEQIKIVDKFKEAGYTLVE
jgi:hypothetical protein